MGSHRRYISLFELAKKIPQKVLKNLLSLYPLTGCDSVSYIFRISKRRALEVLERGSYNLSLGSDDWSPLSDET